MTEIIWKIRYRGGRIREKGRGGGRKREGEIGRNICMYGRHATIPVGEDR